MSYDAKKNFATSLVATAPIPAASGTVVIVTAGDGALFPTVPFNAVVCPAGAAPTLTNAEVVRVTNRVTDTLTITRNTEAQTGSTARAIQVGDQIFAAVTAKSFTDIEANSLPTGVSTDGQVLIGKTSDHSWTPATLTAGTGITITPAAAAITIALSAASNFKIGTTTRDISTASGTQAITGVGFLPRGLILLASVSSGLVWSTGFDNGTNAYCTTSGVVGGSLPAITSFSILVGVDASNFQKATVTTLGADGFTITWTKVGTPTGTANISYMAF